MVGTDRVNWRWLRDLLADPLVVIVLFALGVVVGTVLLVTFFPP
jgi:hypothetical protein